MIHPKFSRFLPLLALALAVAAPVAARAENPLEKLHERLFGDGDDHDKRDKKDKKHDDDDDRNRYREHKHYDVAHDGRCDVCGRAMPVYYREQPVIEVRPSYTRRYETYVEPAPRTSYYERRTEVYPTRSLGSDVQSALRRRGYYNGPIDGDLGPGSRAAIRDFQFARGLTPTGRVDSTLLRALGI